MKALWCITLVILSTNIVVQCIPVNTTTPITFTYLTPEIKSLLENFLNTISNAVSSLKIMLGIQDQNQNITINNENLDVTARIILRDDFTELDFTNNFVTVTITQGSEIQNADTTDNFEETTETSTNYPYTDIVTDYYNTENEKNNKFETDLMEIIPDEENLKVKIDDVVDNKKTKENPCVVIHDQVLKKKEPKGFLDSIYSWFFASKEEYETKIRYEGDCETSSSDESEEGSGILDLEGSGVQGLMTHAEGSGVGYHIYEDIISYPSDEGSGIEPYEGSGIEPYEGSGIEPYEGSGMSKLLDEYYDYPFNRDSIVEDFKTNLEGSGMTKDDIQKSGLGKIENIESEIEYNIWKHTEGSGISEIFTGIDTGDTDTKVDIPIEGSGMHDINIPISQQITRRIKDISEETNLTVLNEFLNNSSEIIPDNVHFIEDLKSKNNYDLEADISQNNSTYDEEEEFDYIALWLRALGITGTPVPPDSLESSTLINSDEESIFETTTMSNKNNFKAMDLIKNSSENKDREMGIFGDEDSGMNDNLHETGKRLHQIISSSEVIDVSENLEGSGFREVSDLLTEPNGSVKSHITNEEMEGSGLEKLSDTDNYVPKYDNDFKFSGVEITTLKVNIEISDESEHIEGSGFGDITDLITKPNILGIMKSRIIHDEIEGSGVEVPDNEDYETQFENVYKTSRVEITTLKYDTQNYDLIKDDNPCTAGIATEGCILSTNNNEHVSEKSDSSSKINDVTDITEEKTTKNDNYTIKSVEKAATENYGNGDEIFNENNKTENLATRVMYEEGSGYNAEYKEYDTVHASKNPELYNESSKKVDIKIENFEYGSGDGESDIKEIKTLLETDKFEGSGLSDSLLNNFSDKLINFDAEEKIGHKNSKERYNSEVTLEEGSGINVRISNDYTDDKIEGSGDEALKSMDKSKEDNFEGHHILSDELQTEDEIISRIFGLSDKSVEETGTKKPQIEDDLTDLESNAENYTNIDTKGTRINDKLRSEDKLLIPKEGSGMNSEYSTTYDDIINENNKTEIMKNYDYISKNTRLQNSDYYDYYEYYKKKLSYDYGYDDDENRTIDSYNASNLYDLLRTDNFTHLTNTSYNYDKYDYNMGINTTFRPSNFSYFYADYYDYGTDRKNYSRNYTYNDYDYFNYFNKNFTFNPLNQNLSNSENSEYYDYGRDELQNSPNYHYDYNVNGTDHISDSILQPRIKDDEISDENTKFTSEKLVTEVFETPVEIELNITYQNDKGSYISEMFSPETSTEINLEVSSTSRYVTDTESHIESRLNYSNYDEIKSETNFDIDMKNNKELLSILKTDYDAEILYDKTTHYDSIEINSETTETKFQIIFETSPIPVIVSDEVLSKETGVIENLEITTEPQIKLKIIATSEPVTDISEDLMKDKNIKVKEEINKEISPEIAPLLNQDFFVQTEVPTEIRLKTIQRFNVSEEIKTEMFSDSVNVTPEILLTTMKENDNKYINVNKTDFNLNISERVDILKSQDQLAAEINTSQLVSQKVTAITTLAPEITTLTTEITKPVQISKQKSRTPMDYDDYVDYYLKSLQDKTNTNSDNQGAALASETKDELTKDINMEMLTSSTLPTTLETTENYPQTTVPFCFDNDKREVFSVAPIRGSIPVMISIHQDEGCMNKRQVKVDVMGVSVKGPAEIYVLLIETPRCKNYYSVPWGAVHLTTVMIDANRYGTTTATLPTSLTSSSNIYELVGNSIVLVKVANSPALLCGYIEPI